MPTRNAEGEVFQWFDTAWDIERADAILKKKPREPELVDVSEFQTLISLPGDPIKFGGVYTNDNVVKRADITFPIYIAIWESKHIMNKKKRMHLCIDGWHRIARAKMDGITELPAFFFNLRESRSIRIR